MKLILEHNVSLSQINPVVETVLQLAGKSISKMPSQSTVHNFVAEGHYIAKRQVSDAMSKDIDILNNEGNVLHFDGTSKFHKNYETFDLEVRSEIAFPPTGT